MHFIKNFVTFSVCLAMMFSAYSYAPYSFSVRGYSDSATAELDASKTQGTCYAGTRFKTTVEVSVDIHGTYTQSDGSSKYVNTQPQRACGQAVANISKVGNNSLWNYVSGLHLVLDGDTTIGSHITRMDF